MTRKIPAVIAMVLFFMPRAVPQNLPPCARVPIPCEQLKLREIELQVLTNLEKQNAHAIQLRNPTFFQDVYADDFSGYTWYGLPLNKTKLVQSIQTSGEQFQSVVASDIQVKMFLDSASVLSLRTEHGASAGKEIARQFRVLRVYVYTTRGWRIVSQVETLLPSAMSR